MNFDKMKTEEITKICDDIGVCPLSQCDPLEALENKDVMCVCLNISRSQATIADPTKLVINDVFPVFMSLDSFLESSIYNLKMNQDASGGFDYKHQGKLAVGSGNE